VAVQVLDTSGGNYRIKIRTDVPAPQSGGNVVAPVYIPFSETQIKSALGNKGTFDSNKNDSLFSRKEVTAARAALESIQREGAVTSTDVLRDLLRVPGYSQWAQSALAGDLDATNALRTELERRFPGGGWQDPKPTQQGVISVYSSVVQGWTEKDLANLAAIADKYDVPIAIRGQFGDDSAIDRKLRDAGFETYVGSQEKNGRPRDVLFSYIRPGGGIHVATPLYSRQEYNQSAQFTPDTAPAAIEATQALNDALVDYGLGPEWSNAYAQATLPDTFSGIREAFQAAFGRDVRPVAPTNSAFDQFNGIYIPSRPNDIYVNVAATPNFLAVAGHELWHSIRRSRPDLIEWYRSVAAPYYKNFPEYQRKLNALLQDGEKPYNADKALEELEGDFLGDSLTDGKFWQQLARPFAPPNSHEIIRKVNSEGPRV